MVLIVEDMLANVAFVCRQYHAIHHVITAKSGMGNKRYYEHEIYAL